MCGKCEDLGYVEVIYDDGDYIEPCSVCNVQAKHLEREINARSAAIKDGYVLSDSGRVLDFKYSEKKESLSFLKKVM